MQDRINALIEQMDRDYGFKAEWREILARKDPEWCELLHKKVMHVRNKGALSPKIREIVLCCMDISAFYEQGARMHMQEAFKAGATEEELIELVEHISLVVGVHTMADFLPIIVEEAERYRKR